MPNTAERTRPLRVVAADPDPAAQAFYRESLAALGHEVRVAGSGRELLDLWAAAPGDLVIAADRLPDGDGFALAEQLCRLAPVPVVVAGCGPGPDAWAAAGCHVAGYLPKPLRAEALAGVLAVAVGCFERLRAARAEAAELRQALEDRKVIERAKGAVARYCGLAEAEAYGRLRRAATDAGRKLVEVAREVLAAADVFARLAAEDGHSRGTSARRWEGRFPPEPAHAAGRPPGMNAS